LKNEENRKRLRERNVKRAEEARNMGKSEVDAAEPDAKQARKEEATHQVEEEYEDDRNGDE